MVARSAWVTMPSYAASYTREMPPIHRPMSTA